jgi:alkylation response protein AidB-like acyl-CoA dehydrogenase
VIIMAIWWVGPAISRYGTEEQQRRFLRASSTPRDLGDRLLRARSRAATWRRPKTRAERQATTTSSPGQKIVDDDRRISDWYFVLASAPRPRARKWAGLTLLLMTQVAPASSAADPPDHRDSDFTEVFMNEVKVPVTNRLVPEGSGLGVVSSALINERTGIAGLDPRRSVRWRKLVATGATQPRPRIRLAPASVRPRHPRPDPPLRRFQAMTTTCTPPQSRISRPA